MEVIFLCGKIFSFRKKRWHPCDWNFHLSLTCKNDPGPPPIALKLLFHWKFTAEDYLQSFCNEITIFNKTQINFWKFLFHCKSTAEDYLQSFCNEIATLNKSQINLTKIVISLQSHCRWLSTSFFQWNNNLKQGIKWILWKLVFACFFTGKVR